MRYVPLSHHHLVMVVVVTQLGTNPTMTIDLRTLSAGQPRAFVREDQGRHAELVPLWLWWWQRWVQQAMSVGIVACAHKMFAWIDGGDG